MDRNAANLYFAKAFLDTLAPETREKLIMIRREHLADIAQSNAEGSAGGKAALRLHGELTRRVFSALAPEQRESLRRFTLRTKGPRLLALPDTAARYNLSKLQARKIQQVVAKYEKQSQDLRMRSVLKSSNELDRRLRRDGFHQSSIEASQANLRSRLKRSEPQIRAIDRKLDAKVLEVLSTSQRRKWQAQTSSTGWRAAKV